jgi:hypothetical protein
LALLIVVLVGRVVIRSERPAPYCLARPTIPESGDLKAVERCHF